MRSVAARLAPGWRTRVDPAWLDGWQPRPFDLGEGATEVVTMGAGAPLLLLPPLPGYKEAWIGVARHLARRHQVITCDLRARFRGRPDWEALIRDLARVADALAPGRAVVVGHSLGGGLAQHWAARHPERVAALVLSSSFARVGSTPGHWRKRYLQQLGVLAGQRLLPERLARPLARRLAVRGAWVYDARCDDRVLDFVRFCIRHLSLRQAARCVRLAYAHDGRRLASALACPTLVVVGERESAWALGAAASLASSIPGAELRTSPAAGHLHLLSAPEWLARTLEDWLADRGLGPT